MLDNFKLRTKLFIAFFAIIIIFAVGLGLIGYELFEIRSNTNNIMADTKKMSGAFAVSQTAEAKYNTFIDLYFTNPSDSSKANEYSTVRTEMKSAINTLKLSLDESENKNLQELEKIDDKMNALYGNEMIAAWQLQDEERMKVVIQKAQKLRDEMRIYASKFVANSRANTNLNKLKINDILDKTEHHFVIVLVVCFVIGLILAFFLTRALTKPIKLLAEASSRIASGDLTGEKLNIRFCKELKNLSQVFNEMQQNLKELVTRIIDTSNQVAAGSKQLADSAELAGDSAQQVAATVEQITSGAQKQQEDTQKTADMIKESVRHIQEINDSVQAMVEQAQSVNKKAYVGSELMENAQAQMDQIANRTSQVHSTIQKLDDRSGQIGKIVEMITNISEQTNLLALNAAIEAARAGEHGRGFAVVAEEVRSLAEQSANATREITNLINEIQTETKEATASIKNGVKDVEMGKEVMDKSRQHFHDISSSIKEITNHIEKIASLTDEQSQGASEILERVDNIAAVTEEASAGLEEASAATQEQNAAVEEITASAQELSEAAEYLKESAAKFKIDENEDTSEDMEIAEEILEEGKVKEADSEKHDDVVLPDDKTGAADTDSLEGEK